MGAASEVESIAGAELVDLLVVRVREQSEVRDRAEGGGGSHVLENGGDAGRRAGRVWVGLLRGES